MEIKLNSEHLKRFLVSLYDQNINFEDIEISKVHVCDQKGDSYFFDNVRVCHIDFKIGGE